MKSRMVVAAAVLLAWGATASAAEPTVAQEKAVCKRGEQQKGTPAPAADAVCTIKVIFQSRIRRRKDDEDVEMTAGSPPLQTDDTETPGPDNWELNLGMQGQWASGSHRVELPIVEFNYGRGDAVQLSYQIPYAFVSDEVDGRSHGVGHSTVGLKYRFYDNKDTGVSFAVGPEVAFATPGGLRTDEDRKTVLRVPLIMTREFEHSSITANLGSEFDSDGYRAFASVGLGRRISPTVAILGELVGNDLNAPDERRFLANLGARKKISGTQSVSGAIGHDLFAGSGHAKATYISFGYQRLFGK